MSQVLENEERLKEVFKSAIVEVLQERRDLVRDLLDDIVEDVAFAKAIDEGEKSPLVNRDRVLEALETAN